MGYLHNADWRGGARQKHNAEGGGGGKARGKKSLRTTALNGEWYASVPVVLPSHVTIFSTADNGR